MIGQDDILFNRDRTHTYKANSEVFTYKLEREIFEKMLKEFSEIREELLSEANERKKYAVHLENTRKAIDNKEAKLVIKQFNVVQMNQNYESQKLQKSAATRMRDGVFRRSNEFLFKDKRLKNAQPNLEDGSGDMRRAPSKNPKLHKIRQR